MTSPEILQKEIETAATNSLVDVLDEKTCAFLFPDGKKGIDPDKIKTVVGLLKHYGVLVMSDITSSGTKQREVASGRHAITTYLAYNLSPNRGDILELVKELDSNEAIGEYFMKKLTEKMDQKIHRIMVTFLPAALRK